MMFGKIHIHTLTCLCYLQGSISLYPPSGDQSFKLLHTETHTHTCTHTHEGTITHMGTRVSNYFTHTHTHTHIRGVSLYTHQVGTIVFTSHTRTHTHKDTHRHMHTLEYTRTQTHLCYLEGTITLYPPSGDQSFKLLHKHTHTHTQTHTLITSLLSFPNHRDSFLCQSSISAGSPPEMYDSHWQRVKD